MQLLESAREFLLDYFVARTREIEREVAAHQSFRQQYFANSCLWGSRPLAVEVSASEKVIAMEEDENTVVAITGRLKSLPALRYTLGKQQQSWRIFCVQPACADCNGAPGDVSCVICRGSGWLQVPPA